MHHTMGTTTHYPPSTTTSFPKQHARKSIILAAQVAIRVFVIEARCNLHIGPMRFAYFAVCYTYDNSVSSTLIMTNALIPTEPVIKTAIILYIILYIYIYFHNDMTICQDYSIVLTTWMNSNVYLYY